MQAVPGIQFETQPIFAEMEFAMIIGCPTEIKTRENRVGLIPASAAVLTGKGHQVLVQKGAGL